MGEFLTPLSHCCFIGFPSSLLSLKPPEFKHKLNFFSPLLVASCNCRIVGITRGVLAGKELINLKFPKQGAWKEGDGDEMKKIVACNEAMINEKIEKVWESEVLSTCTKAMHSISEDADVLKDALKEMEDEMLWDVVNPIYGRIVNQRCKTYAK